MSAREASCPGCGATITFRTGASVLVVCPYCDSASYRGDVDLELLGKVAAVADVQSVLALGATGKRRDKGWVAVGLVQLDHGAGPWNEWALALDDGSSAWVAEAQGELLVSREVPAPPGPLRSELGPGKSVDLADRKWVVAEIGEGRVTTARGEIPSDLVPGATYAYADLRGPGNAFATINYGTGEDQAPTVAFVGQTITVADLGIDASTVPEREPKRVEARRISCRSCGQSIDVRHPDESKRVGCPSCGSLIGLETPDGVLLDEHKRRLKAPALPLGALAKLRGMDVEVLAMLERSVRVEGVRYPWSEYLLRVKSGGYRWLVEAKGHWSLVEPASLGDISRIGTERGYLGGTFKHFQSGKARVDVVMGEVYWAVQRGEEVETDDYVDPPRMLSTETSEKEKVASVGHYVPRAEIYAAFGPDVKLPAPEGVAPHQPNALRSAQRFWWRAGGLAAVAVLVLWIVFLVRAQNREVFRGSFAWVTQPPATAPTAPPAAPTEPAVAATPPPEPNTVFTEPFELTASEANLRVRIQAPEINNRWLGVNGALVNLDSGEVRYFSVVAERWSGVSDGESWTEGDREGTVYLGRVPAGRYALRLDSESETSVGAPAGSTPWSVVVTSQVASKGRPWMFMVLLLLPALIVSIRAAVFEGRRWSESDHAE